MMVAERIGKAISVRALRGASELELQLVPAELELAR
jgi:hypothetical protein